MKSFASFFESLPLLLLLLPTAYTTLISIPPHNDVVVPLEQATLDAKNTLVLSGVVDESMADNFITDFVKRPVPYVFIDSPGGSVMAGNRIVTFLKNKDVKCIAQKAYSMAFVILQGCKERYITETATVMQHQMSYGRQGDLYPMTNYLNMLHSIETYLNRMQAMRIGLTDEEFRILVTTEWWLFGPDVVVKNVADGIMEVECTKGSAEQTRTTERTKMTLFGPVKVRATYSQCPLVSWPLAVTLVESDASDIFADDLMSMEIDHIYRHNTLIKS